MAQAIMALYPRNIWSKAYPSNTQRTLHWILQCIGSSTVLAGIIIEYIGRWQKSKDHFISTHSTIGLIAGISTLIVMLSGTSALWSIKLKKYARPLYFKLMHTVGGMTVFILGKFHPTISSIYLWYQKVFYSTGMTALYYGYDKNFMVKRSSEIIRRLLQGLLLCQIIWTLFGAARGLRNQLRIIFAK